MKPTRILILIPAALLLTGLSALAQGACPPAQQCPNGPRVPFPIVSPVQNLNALAQRLQRQREQQPAPTVPWNYAPVATPPQNLPPELQR